jgi:hypothetical protein
MLVRSVLPVGLFFGGVRARRQASRPSVRLPDCGFILSEDSMVDRASLQLIGFLLVSVTACVIIIAATLVYRSTGDRPAPWQAEQTAVLQHA